MRLHLVPLSVKPTLLHLRRIGCTSLLATLVLAQLGGEDIVVNARAAGRPFPHFWEQIFGSGRAILSLRDSYRQDLRTMKAATAIQYVRFHAIFHDEVGVYDEDAGGRLLYNWSYVDQIYDGLLENGVRPFVEMSFMPRKLAASLEPHAFWYKPLPSPPKDYPKWGDLVYNFARHLVDRYGIDEVAQWYFEVWNEPNIDFWTGQPKQATYFELYDHAARAIKRADLRLRVGGPATAQAAWVSAMVRCMWAGSPQPPPASSTIGSLHTVRMSTATCANSGMVMLASVMPLYQPSEPPLR